MERPRVTMIRASPTHLASRTSDKSLIPLAVCRRSAERDRLCQTHRAWGRPRAEQSYQHVDSRQSPDEGGGDPSRQILVDGDDTGVAVSGEAHGHGRNAGNVLWRPSVAFDDSSLGRRRCNRPGPRSTANTRRTSPDIPGFDTCALSRRSRDGVHASPRGGPGVDFSFLAPVQSTVHFCRGGAR